MQRRLEYILYALIIVLLFPALLINLGLMPLIEDESIRGLVALEMLFSNDYITPTLGDVLYFNKPPFFNWLIVGSFKIFQSYSEWAIRFPMIISLIFFGFTIFLSTRKLLGTKYAFINAFAFITCGRILFYDAMFGLIDITYSWVIYVLFISIYEFHKREYYGLLYIVTYLLTALGFLLKGFPTLLFTGLTLLAYFIYTKRFKKLFHLFHFIAFTLFIGMIGSYYYIYVTRNDISVNEIFTILFSRSMIRTFVYSRVIDTLLHMIQFPTTYIPVHFAPWTILLLLLLSKKVRNEIWSNDQTKFCIIAFAANIAVYWVSPNIYPRYLFMFVPLLFTVLIFSLKFAKRSNVQWAFYIEKFFFIGIICAVLSQAVVFIVPEIKTLPNVQWLIPLSSVVLSIGVVLYHKFEQLRWLIIILSILVVRIEFNQIILPYRYQDSNEKLYRGQAQNIGQLTKGKDLWLFQSTPSVAIDSTKFINYQSVYYLSATREEIVKRNTDIDTSAYYVIYDGQLSSDIYRHYYDMTIRHRNKVTKIVKFKDLD